MTPLLTLQHDGHNSLDRIALQLESLDKWNKELSLFQKDHPEIKIPNQSRPYVVAEYLRSHIKEMRDLLNAYYNEVKKNEEK